MRHATLPACLALALLLGAAATPPVAPAAAPVLERAPDATVATAATAATSATAQPADAMAAIAPSDTSATAGEMARLARLAQQDGARRAAEASVRNAPGRTDIESGGMRRCVDATGGAVFTDQRCDSVGATDAPPEVPLPNVASARITSVRSCARSTSDLLEGVRYAFEVRDVNRLADYYQWTGMDGATGYRLMDRLEAMTRRPFIDAQLVSSAAPRPMDPGIEQDSVGLLSRPFDLADTPSPRIPPPGRPRRVDLLRVDQMRSERDAAAQVTWFHLRAEAGCWWVTF
jgi:hypothetical protein